MMIWYELLIIDSLKEVVELHDIWLSICPLMVEQPEDYIVPMVKYFWNYHLLIYSFLIEYIQYGCIKLTTLQRVYQLLSNIYSSNGKEVPALLSETIFVDLHCFLVILWSFAAQLEKLSKSIEASASEISGRIIALETNLLPFVWYPFT